ncbi:MAG: zinc-binding dehydrogenase [Bdellovibrionota bacterium]
MKAARFYGPEDLRLETVQMPELNAGEILVKVQTALTCGTDFKAYRQGHPVLLGENYPTPFGHEGAGIVEKVGPGVTKFKPGMRVVAANTAPCGTCYYCKKNRANLCDNLEFLNGTFAEYIKIPASIANKNTYEIPEGLSFRHAAITEPFSCAVHAYHRLNIQPQDTVVILGCGIMGLLFTAVAIHHGAQIIAVGRNEDKLEIARKMGAHHILNVKNSSDPIQDVLKVTDGRGADFVIEAVGKTEAWEQAFKMTAKGGTVCFFGGCKKGLTFPLDTYRTHYEEVNAQGIFHHTPHYFQMALRYLQEGVLNPDLLITKEIKLDQIPDFFKNEAFSSPFKTAVLP